MSSTESLVLEFLRLRHGGEALSVEAFLARCPDPPADLEVRLREAAAWTPGRVAEAQGSQTPAGGPKRSPGGIGSPQSPEEVDPTLLIQGAALRPDPGTTSPSEYHQRYQFVRQLGEGGFGVVHLVRDQHYNGELRALKVIRSEHTKDALLSRFRNEIVVLRALNHDGIPLIYNDGLTPTGEIYYTMTYVEGPTLREVLERGDPIPTERLVQWARQLLSILEYAHSRGVVHRDLKPSNIVLENEGTDKERLQVLDFGIAKVVGREGPLADAKTLVTGVPIGTPDYMSPEQVTGEGVDGRTDIFSLGIILYQFCGGRLPFKGETSFQSALARVSQKAKPLDPTEAPAWFASWIDKLLAKDAQERPTVGTALALLLDAVTAASKPKPRSRAALLATVPLLLIALVGYSGWEWRRTKNPQPSGDTESARRDGSLESTDREGQTPTSKSPTSDSPIAGPSAASLPSSPEERSGSDSSTEGGSRQDSTDVTAPGSNAIGSRPGGPSPSDPGIGFEAVDDSIEEVDDQRDRPGTATGDTEPAGVGLDRIPVPALADGPSDPDNVNSDPSTVDPGTVDPGTVDPGTVDPGTVDPGTVDPGTVDPGKGDPSNVGPSPEPRRDPDEESIHGTGSPLEAVVQEGTDSEPTASTAASQGEPPLSEPVIPKGSSQDSFHIQFTRLLSNSLESVDSGSKFHTNHGVLSVTRGIPAASQDGSNDELPSFETFMYVVVRDAELFHIYDLPELKVPLTSASPMDLRLPASGVYRIAVLSSDHMNLWYKEHNEDHLLATWVVHYESTAPTLESDLESEDQHTIEGDRSNHKKARLIGTRNPTLVGSAHDNAPGELAEVLYSFTSPDAPSPKPGSEENRDSWVRVEVEDDGTFRVPLSLPEDSDGLSLAIVARDRAGNPREHTVDIQVDLAAPRVTLERTRPGSTAEVDLLEMTEVTSKSTPKNSAPHLTTQDEWLDLGFRVQDANPLELLVDGLPQPFEDETGFQRHPIDLGFHEFEIVATDQVKNQRTYTFNVLRMPKPPTRVVYECSASFSPGPRIPSRTAETTEFDSQGIQHYRLEVPTMKPWAPGRSTNVRVTIDSPLELELAIGKERNPPSAHEGESQTFEIQLAQEEKTHHVRLEARDHEGTPRIAAILELSVYHPWQPDGFRAGDQANLQQHPEYPSTLVHKESGLEFVLVAGTPDVPWIYLSKHEVTWGMADAVGWELTPEQLEHFESHGLNIELARDHPLVLVHGDSAIRLAAAFGASLPTFEEWIRGVRRERPRVGSPLLGDGNALNASTAAISVTLDYEGHLTRAVGTHPADTTWCGIEDMVGNVSELIGDGTRYVGANVRSALTEQETPAGGIGLLHASNAHGVRLVLRCTP